MYCVCKAQPDVDKRVKLKLKITHYVECEVSVTYIFVTVCPGV